MKIAFVGKGGSGKTTLSSLFVRHLASAGAPVVAIDADINQHLGVALGLSEDEAAAIPAMGEHLPEIKDVPPWRQARNLVTVARWSRRRRRAADRDCCGPAARTRSSPGCPSMSPARS